MLTNIKVVTFLLALVIGTLMFLDKAHAQVVELGGHPVCDPSRDGCTGDFVDCSCEDKCFFGAGVQDPASATACAVTEGYLDCVQNVSFSCMGFQGAEFGNCVRTGSASCSEQLNTCVGNCLAQ